jgi:DHA2 family multidrug resistance protein-like MFS transporter
MIYGLKRIAETGPGWGPAVSILIGLALGVLFVRRQRTLADPLIDLRLFRAPAFSASLAAYMLACFVAFGAYVFIAQYLQLVLGLSPLQAGLWTVPSMLAFVAGSMLVPPIARRFRPAHVVAGGLLLAAAGFGVLALVDAASGLALLVIGSIVYSLGVSPVIVLATDLVVGSAPVERAGSASAISETSSELGGALGIAILGSIGTAVYRRAMADAVPAGVPPEAAEAARATLGGALAVAAGLPAQLGAGLLGSAREAFTQGLQLTAVICAAVVLATAVPAALLLRRVGAGSAPEPHREDTPKCATC